MIVDAFAHVGPTLLNHTDVLAPLFDVTTPEKLIARMDLAGIDVAIIRAPRWVGGTVFDPSYAQANAAVRDAVKKYPRRFLGYGRVNPNWGSSAVEEASRCLGEYALRGLLLDPAWENFNPTNRTLVYPIVEVARRHQVPVMFHSGYHPAQPALFWELALDFGDVPIILAHMGERLVADALIVAARTSNIYLETSDHMYMLAACVKTLGAGRVLFGSNMPFSIPEAEMLKITDQTNISEEDKDLVLGGAAVRLHGLE